MSNTQHLHEKNVLGGPLSLCSCAPQTGFFRDGFCRTDKFDTGKHTLCAQMTDAFLQFSLEKGNDLITPNAANQFPGLKAGDRWCLCVLRWKEALEAGVAPPVILEACHSSVLKEVTLTSLKDHSTALAH